MKKKIILFLSVFCVCLCLTGCSPVKYKRDIIKVWNKTSLDLDDVYIYTKDGYFYDTHEKFKVDDDTIAVTIYFIREDLNDNGDWDSPQTEG